MSRVFYVCSYGGSGSTMLTRYLSQFGESYHVHGRYPPLKLTKLVDAITDNPQNDAKWFGNEELSAEELERTTVIFIYRNPAKAINSRFINPLHLQNIQLSGQFTLLDVLRDKKDYYGINEFYWNYVSNNSNRNYPIFCVKYETIFSNWAEFNKALNLPPIDTYPENRERKFTQSIESNMLYSLYRPLALTMIAMPPIYCVVNGLADTASTEPIVTKFKTKTINKVPQRDLRKLVTYSTGKPGTCWKKVG